LRSKQALDKYPLITHIHFKEMWGEGGGALRFASLRLSGGGSLARLSFAAAGGRGADFALFKLATKIMSCKEHLTNEGLNRLLSIKASLNRGLNKNLIKAFSDIIPVDRPVVECPNSLDPNGLVGFIEGEGNFFFCFDFKI
jgi:hypothetical protein